MVEYFEDQAGQWRYRVKGENGEPMVTSEGHRDRTDAERGYAALERAIAREHFTPEWPGGILHFDSLPTLLGTIVDKRLVPAERQPSRLEGGPVQFGDDWPGLWLRGDACHAYALALKAERSQSSNAFSRAGVDGLITALEATNVNRRGASSNETS